MENVHHGNAKLCGIMSARRTMCLSLAHLSGFSQLSMNRNAQRFKNLISEWKKDSSYSNSNSISPLFHQLCMILCVNLFNNFNKWTNLFFNVSTEVWQQPSLFSPMHLNRKFQISDFTVLIYYFKWYEKHCHMSSQNSKQWWAENNHKNIRTSTTFIVRFSRRWLNRTTTLWALIKVIK